MIWALGIALLPTSGLFNLDGQAAVERAKRLLRDIGVKESLTLTGLVNGDWYSKEPSWTVSFKAPHTTATMALNARTGRPNRLIIQDVRGREPVDNHRPTADEIRQVHRVLGILGYGRDIDSGSDVGFSGTGSFHVLVHGLPFFNLNPTYGPVLASWTPSSPSLVFYACPPIPPVNAWKPRIGAAVAVEKIRGWGHVRAKARKLPPQVDPSVGDLVGELGYWKLKDRPEARLVWRATKYTTIQGRRYGLGALRMFVDALTGEYIEPDDPLWGANP